MCYYDVTCVAMTSLFQASSVQTPNSHAPCHASVLTSVKDVTERTIAMMGVMNLAVQLVSVVTL